MELFYLGISILIALVMGKFVSKIKLPAILGWLLAGMLLGPHAFHLLDAQILESDWFIMIEKLLECIVGLMIGTEMVWNKLKKSGKQILIMTLTESIGTFIAVSVAFGIIFYIVDVPLYLAFLFGGIALATAPAPSLSIVNEFKTDGPVTKTLIPMAALDDLVGAIIFFTVIAVVATQLSTTSISIGAMLLFVFIPVFLGLILGFMTGKWLQKLKQIQSMLMVLIGMLLVCVGSGFWISQQLPLPIFNFMLLGMGFSAAFSNCIQPGTLDQIMKYINPAIHFSLVIVILNLGAPLDYHLILNAGFYTLVYILVRAIGKYIGAYMGAKWSHAPDTVRKYLGFTLLPHSGVSLVFTGIAVSMLQNTSLECATILQGTIAAAAVINEVIAVFFAKKGFEWAKELNQGKEGKTCDKRIEKEKADKVFSCLLSRNSGH